MLVKRDAPPAFVLCAQPRVHQRDAGDFDCVRFHRWRRG